MSILTQMQSRRLMNRLMIFLSLDFYVFVVPESSYMFCCFLENELCLNGLCNLKRTNKQGWPFEDLLLLHIYYTNRQDPEWGKKNS